jgi:hypothetical protein
MTEAERLVRDLRRHGLRRVGDELEVQLPDDLVEVYGPRLKANKDQVLELLSPPPAPEPPAPTLPAPVRRKASPPTGRRAAHKPTPAPAREPSTGRFKPPSAPTSQPPPNPTNADAGHDGGLVEDEGRRIPGWLVVVGVVAAVVALVAVAERGPGQGTPTEIIPGYQVGPRY